MENMESMKKLQALAERFGKDRKGIKSLKELKEKGWTEEEIALLPQVPRSEEGQIKENGCYRWPFIGGVPTYPFSGCLTEAERQAYYAYKRQHPVKNPGRLGSDRVSETDKKAEELKKTLRELGASPEIMAKVEELFPTKKGKFFNVFGVNSPEELPEKVEKRGLLFGMINPTNEELATFIMKGGVPKYSPQELDKILAAFETRYPGQIASRLA